MAKMVFGIFNSREDAEDAINDLEEEGFNAREISLMMRDRKEAENIAHNTGANVAGGIASGAVTGAVIGGLAGLLIGIGAITIPGVGAFLVGGPIATVLGLTGAGATTASGAATGALAGGVVGGLVSLGVPEEDARVYDRRIQEGAILLAVPSRSGKQKDVQEIMDDNSAEQVRTIDVSDRQ